MTQDEKSRLLELPPAERLELAQMLWQSVEGQIAELPLTAEQQLLLDERLKAYLNDPDDVLTWEEVKERLSAV